MKSVILASIVFFASTGLSGQSTSTAREWAGVWQMSTAANKPGGSITLADDGGVLTGVIVFNVMSREIGQRIGIETRTMVNPHIQGNRLVFQVRRILKPHLEGDPSTADDVPDPADIADMTLTLSSIGNAVLACPKCGDASSTEVKKLE